MSQAPTPQELFRATLDAAALDRRHLTLKGRQEPIDVVVLRTPERR